MRGFAKPQQCLPYLARGRCGGPVSIEAARGPKPKRGETLSSSSCWLGRAANSATAHLLQLVTSKPHEKGSQEAQGDVSTQISVVCDEVLPECSQCRRSRRCTCTGSRTGLFIIATSENVNQNAVAKGRLRDSLCRSPPGCAQLETPSASPCSNDGDDFQLPPPSPSRTGAFEQLFVAHFVRSFGDTRDHPPFWPDKLSEFFTSSIAGPVKDSIRAAAMLILPASDPNANFRIAQTTDDMVVCAPIMMCHFEIMAASSSDGWINHIEAAASMLKIKGPSNCRLGLEHEMFLTLFVSMTTNEAHPFTSEQWMTVPFEKRSKNLWDELLDIFLLLPRCLTLSEEVLKPGRQEWSGIESKLRDSVLDLVSRLNHWRLRYPNAEDGLGSSNLNADPDAPTRRSDYATCTALVAVFDAANVIAISLLLLVSPVITHHIYNYRTQLHAQAVISADVYLDSNYVIVPGGGCLLMAFALKIVGLWAPLKQQRDYATKKLQNWDSQRSVHSRRRFAAPVPLEPGIETEASNVYYANIAIEIWRRRHKSVVLQ
ncbi:hypothetical protein B7463_g12212, partial [Scytalidium lignicola]